MGRSERGVVVDWHLHHDEDLCRVSEGRPDNRALELPLFSSDSATDLGGKVSTCAVWL